MNCLSSVKNGVLLKIRAQPHGKRNAVRGWHDDCLKVEITAAPEDGKANRALIKLLAQTLQVPAANIHQQSGETARVKTLLIVNGERENLMARINESLIMK